VTYDSRERLVEGSEPGMAFPDILRFSQLDVTGRRVFLRVDLATPRERLGHDPALRPLQATLDALVKQRCKVLIAGDADEPSTLPGVARELSSLLKQPVAQLGRDFMSKIGDMKEGQVALAPSLSHFAEERNNDGRWAAHIAQVIDVYVNEAPRASLEARASMVALPRLMASRAAGPLLGHDLDMTRDFVDLPASPYVAVIGGSGLERKLPFLLGLLDRIQTLLLGGPIANTFLVAGGWAPRGSHYEADALDAAARVQKKARERGVRVVLPVDGLIALQGDKLKCRPLSELQDGEAVLDIGHDTWNAYGDVLTSAATVLWSGSLGHTTPVPMMQGTQVIAEVAAQAAYCGAVGEDTVAMASSLGLSSKISWLAKGGDAALELMAGIVAPGIESLRQPASPHRVDALPV
jgi:phosphoglycerate kinase